jgi:uncharacterized Fe-S cluster protein YjdI
MKITVDNERTYNISILPMTNHFLKMYRGDNIDIHGKIQASNPLLARNSLVMTALKSLITPIVIPWLKTLYLSKGLTLLPPVKHENLIDYSVKAIAAWTLEVGEYTHVNITTQICENSERSIKNAITIFSKPEKDAITNRENEIGTEN